ncbi:MAG: hypothetical protein PW786_01480 [Arachidicoccus sp.]|nr:hypothetical protein [Arachidicoccus sp.]
MKKLLLCVLLIGGCFFYQNSAKAQVSVNINIGTQPAWGPTGYDYVQYYYLPDINVYYNVSKHMFIYLSNGRWLSGRNLPTRYNNYDLYNSYKVVVNRSRPYRNNDQDKRMYEKYKGGNHNQEVIRDAHDKKYFVNKENKYHSQSPNAKEQRDDRHHH